ncbi:hypothetical protein NLI96_g2597 [Meripilus lineatus]|uniref:Uncharacterized protein n=1 Tax=Meripilus lineatus TaxID=2056292 RepID=A0AAD5V851_9APHY|nr:hypothetical protein NLI96_g2597 [Physisporinus lineatus]
MDSSPILDLVRAATSLREVYFGIRFFPPFRVVPGHISLSQNTSLETLIIGIVYLVWEPFGVPDFGWLPDTLKDIASTCFRQFKIQIRIENTTQFSYIPWGRIDGILCCPEFPSFRQLTIELCSRSSMPWRGLEYEGELSANEVLPVARRYLPNLAARGALTVIETPPS